MFPEQRETAQQSRKVIELCGTPFAARNKFLVHNSIEDMITERIGVKVRGIQGITNFHWLTCHHEASRMEYFERVQQVQRLMSERFPSSGVLLVQDGAFSAMIATEVSRKAKILSDKEADNLLIDLLPYTQMNDLTILTLVTPRAALVRELYPEELEGHDGIMRKMFIFFSIFNDSAKELLERHKEKLAPVKVIRPSGDEFPAEQVFFENANSVFEFLNLPSIEEWTKHLENHPDLRCRKHGILGGVSVAGLTDSEIREHIKKWDWSQQPDKRARVDGTTFQIISILKEHKLIPDE